MSAPNNKENIDPYYQTKLLDYVKTGKEPNPQYAMITEQLRLECESSSPEQIGYALSVAESLHQKQPQEGFGLRLRDVVTATIKVEKSEQAQKTKEFLQGYLKDPMLLNPIMEEFRSVTAANEKAATMGLESIKGMHKVRDGLKDVKPIDGNTITPPRPTGPLPVTPPQRGH